MSVGFILSVTVFFPKVENFGINNTSVNDEVTDDLQNNSGKSDLSTEPKDTGSSDEKLQDTDTSDDSDDTTQHDNPNLDNPDNPEKSDISDGDTDNLDDNTDKSKSNDPDNPNEFDTFVNNEYSFQILQNNNIIFDKESKGTIYSGKAGSDFVVYTFKISANYEFEIGYSNNVVITKSETVDFDKTFEFYISSGTEFCFVLDGKTCNFVCEEYKNFSFVIRLARGQNATTENNTVEFWDTNGIKLQVQVYVNGSLYENEIVADKEFTSNGLYMFFELERSCTINFHTVDNKFSFSINFVKTNK